MSVGRLSRLGANIVTTRGRLMRLGATAATPEAKGRLMRLGAVAAAPESKGRLLRLMAHSTYNNVTITKSKTDTLIPGEPLQLTTNAASPVWEVIAGNAEIIGAGTTVTVRPAGHAGPTAGLAARVQVTDTATGSSRTTDIISYPTDEFEVEASGAVVPVVSYRVT